MPDGRGARLALESAFLVVVAGVLVAARFSPAWIVLAMLVAWLIVAALEWAAWREEPHWSSGLPPRYHVPEQPLPPRPPSVELPSFTTYPRPAPREVEAPTWIATPQMREEVLGWPAAGLDGEAPPVDDPQTTVEEVPDGLPVEAAASVAVSEEPEVGWPVTAEPLEDPWVVLEPEPVAAEPEPVAVEPEPEPVAVEPEPEPVAAEPEPEPVAVEPEPVAAEPEQEPVAVEPEPEPEPVAFEPEPVALEPEPVVAEAGPPAVVPVREPVAVATARAARPARHRLDPFAEPSVRRWRRGRGGELVAGVVELPRLPQHIRLEPNGRGGGDF